MHQQLHEAKGRHSADSDCTVKRTTEHELHAAATPKLSALLARPRALGLTHPDMGTCSRRSPPAVRHLPVTWQLSASASLYVSRWLELTSHLHAGKTPRTWAFSDDRARGS